MNALPPETRTRFALGRGGGTGRIVLIKRASRFVDMLGLFLSTALVEYEWGGQRGAHEEERRRAERL